MLAFKNFNHDTSVFEQLAYSVDEHENCVKWTFQELSARRINLGETRKAGEKCLC